MRRPRLTVVGLVALLCLILAAVCLLRRLAFTVDQASPAGRPPHTDPDYSDTVVPPNIAPLNFAVLEPGTHYRVTISGAQGGEIDIRSGGPSIRVPQSQWAKMLQANRGGEVRTVVCAKGKNGGWTRFDATEIRVAEEEIDGYLAYRWIKPLYNYWRHVGVYQRDLSCFSRQPIIHGDDFSGACVNCHTFQNNRTELMTVGIRSSVHGAATVLVDKGQAVKLDPKFGYTSWHPQQRLAALSQNHVRQFFHHGRGEVRDVVDLASDLAFYDVDGRKLVKPKQLARADRLETYPTWTPDGRSLYFCSSHVPWPTRKQMPPERFDEARYDLMRVPFDPVKGFGEVETVLAAVDTGLSVLLPRVSPDGNLLLFTMCDYGCFPIYQPSADLYMMDLRTGEHWRLDINSDRSESWHSWSSNSRWIAFSSKRRDGLFTRTYFSYVHPDGRVEKPFILPQEDPTYYNRCLRTYTVPELISEPVTTHAKALAEVAKSIDTVKVEAPTEMPAEIQAPEPGEVWYGPEIE